MEQQHNKPLQDEDVMQFGKFKNHKLEDVPAKYLIFLYNHKDQAPNYRGQLKDFHGRLMLYIADNMDVLEKEIEEQKNPKK